MSVHRLRNIIRVQIRSTVNAILYLLVRACTCTVAYTKRGTENPGFDSLIHDALDFVANQTILFTTRPTATNLPFNWIIVGGRLKLGVGPTAGIE